MPRGRSLRLWRAFGLRPARDGWSGLFARPLRSLSSSDSLGSSSSSVSSLVTGAFVDDRRLGKEVLTSRCAGLRSLSTGSARLSPAVPDPSLRLAKPALRERRALTWRAVVRAEVTCQQTGSHRVPAGTQLSPEEFPARAPSTPSITSSRSNLSTLSAQIARGALPRA